MIAIAAMFTSLMGCSPKQVTGLQCSLDEGWLISDEVYFTNSSGQELSNVHITMTLTGDRGTSRSYQRYWATWHLGDKQMFSISADDSVIHIQRVDLTGSSDQGSISQSWVKK